MIKNYKEFNQNFDNIKDEQISNLIKRKLDGDNLSHEDKLKLHYWMMENDKEYSKEIDRELNKGLKKYIKSES